MNQKSIGSNAIADNSMLHENADKRYLDFPSLSKNPSTPDCIFRSHEFLSKVIKKNSTQ
jgi:hypothetical protein